MKEERLTFLNRFNGLLRCDKTVETVGVFIIGGSSHRDEATVRIRERIQTAPVAAMHLCLLFRISTLISPPNLSKHEGVPVVFSAALSFRKTT